MTKSKDSFSMDWDKIKLKLNGTVVDYPILRIKISGDPSLKEFIRFMRDIESFTDDFEKDYISITDFSDLTPNRIIESLISLSSNNLLRSITFVSNQSKISFVILGKDTKSVALKNRLKDVNKPRSQKDYSYNYHFIQKESQIKDIAENFFGNE